MRPTRLANKLAIIGVQASALFCKISRVVCTATFYSSEMTLQDECNQFLKSSLTSGDRSTFGSINNSDVADLLYLSPVIAPGSSCRLIRRNPRDHWNTLRIRYLLAWNSRRDLSRLQRDSFSLRTRETRKKKKRKKNHTGESQGATRSSGPESKTFAWFSCVSFVLLVDEQATRRRIKQNEERGEGDTVIYLLPGGLIVLNRCIESLSPSLEGVINNTIVLYINSWVQLESIELNMNSCESLQLKLDSGAEMGELWCARRVKLSTKSPAVDSSRGNLDSRVEKSAERSAV